MPEEKRFTFNGDPERLDRFLARQLAPLSRNRVQRLIDEQHVKVNGQTVPARFRLAQGDRVEATLPDFSSLPPSSASEVPILYEDEHLLVVNKPAGVVVHPAGPHRKDTLVQRLWPKLEKEWGASVRERGSSSERPGVVHRLDRGTSGVMVIAKTPLAGENLSRQFEGRQVKKIYWALVHGIPRTSTGTIRSSVGRSRRHPYRMSTTNPGRPSETEFKVLNSFLPEKIALLELRPLTGRTHQLRVQLSALDHPIMGDVLYGSQKSEPASRPLLHALSLEFSHPKSAKRLSFEAALPDDFKNVLKNLGWKKK